uniref:Uncharacterized protein n=1 Tax=Rhizophora mucronata TaxID=61149 RepID=A0A2P2P216_RHIMU
MLLFSAERFPRLLLLLDTDSGHTPSETSRLDRTNELSPKSS